MTILSIFTLLDADENPGTPPNVDIREELRLKFKVEMPQDFFDFWDYCKSINPAKPSGNHTSSLSLTSL